MVECDDLVELATHSCVTIRQGGHGPGARGRWAQGRGIDQKLQRFLFAGLGPLFHEQNVIRTEPLVCSPGPSEFPAYRVRRR